MEVNKSRRVATRPPVPADPLVTPAGLVVRRWRGKPRLSGEDKIAWACLYTLTRGGRERVAITPGQLGDDQGTSSDAGRKRIKNLVAANLLRVVEHDEARGVYIVELLDVPEGDQLIAIEGDQQHSFEFTTEQPSEIAAPAIGVLPLRVSSSGREEPPVEPPALPPAEPRRSPLPSERGYLTPSPSVTPSVNLRKVSEGERVQGDRGSAGGSAVAPRPIGTVLDRVLTPPTPAELHERREQYITHWKRRIGDERMRLTPLVKLANAVLDGRLQPGRVEECLADLDETDRRGLLRNNRSSFANGFIKRLLREAGVPR